MFQLSGDAERRSLPALRSYFSTLRRMLDPIAPRARDNYSWIVQESERYYLRSHGVW